MKDELAPDLGLTRRAFLRVGAGALGVAALTTPLEAASKLPIPDLMLHLSSATSRQLAGRPREELRDGLNDHLRISQFVTSRGPLPVHILAIRLEAGEVVRRFSPPGFSLGPGTRLVSEVSVLPDLGFFPPRRSVPEFTEPLIRPFRTNEEMPDLRYRDIVRDWGSPNSGGNSVAVGLFPYPAELPVRQQIFTQGLIIRYI